jgi:hypothetical protein
MRKIGVVLGLGLALSLACMHPSAPRQARIEGKLDAVNAKVDRVLAAQALSQEALDELVLASRRQGTGEITLFFGWGNARVRRGSSERDRYVRFLDRLAFEARGREVVLVAVGAAGDWKQEDRNVRLSGQRAATARVIAKQQLVNVPHRWVRAYGVGAAEAPGDHGGRTWRHVRIIAVYDDAQLPALPPKP